ADPLRWGQLYFARIPNIQKIAVFSHQFAAVSGRVVDSHFAKVSSAAREIQNQCGCDRVVCLITLTVSAGRVGSLRTRRCQASLEVTGFEGANGRRERIGQIRFSDYW